MLILNNPTNASSNCCCPCFQMSCLFNWLFKKNSHDKNAEEELANVLEKSYDSATPVAWKKNFRNCNAPSPEKSTDNSPVGSPTIQMTRQQFPPPPPLHIREASTSFELLSDQDFINPPPLKSR